MGQPIKEQALAKVHDLHHDRVRLIQKFNHDISQNVFALGQTPPVQGIIRALDNDGFDALENSSLDDWKRRLQTIFINYVRAQGYLQIRYIQGGKEGKEIVRVDSSIQDLERYKVTPEEKLQVKGNSTYMQEAIKLLPDKVYQSEMSLNREHGVIEVPYQPTQRFASPIYHLKWGEDRQKQKRLRDLIHESISLDNLENELLSVIRSIVKLKRDDLGKSLKKKLETLKNELAFFRSFEGHHNKQVFMELENQTYKLESQILNFVDQEHKDSEVLSSEFNNIKSVIENHITNIKQEIQGIIKSYMRSPFGAIVVNVDLNYLFDELEKFDDEGTQFYIINSKGDYLYHEEPSKRFVFDLGGESNIEIDYPGILQEIISHHSGGHLHMPTIGKTIYSDAINNKSGDGQDGLYSVTIIDNVLILSEISEIRRGLLIIGLLILIFTSVIGFILLHILLKPARILTQQAVNYVKRGNRGRLDVIRSSDEIGKLSQAFSQLVRKLRDANQNLESKILDRTKDLKKSEVFTKAVLDSAMDSIITIDTKGMILSCNPSTGNMFGYAPEQLIGKNVNILMPEPYKKEA